MAQSLGVLGLDHPPVLGRVRLGPTPLNLRGLARAPQLGRVRLGIPTAAVADITADLMDSSSPATVVAALPLTKGRAWTEQLSEAGSAGITFQNDDPALASVGEGSLVRMSLKGVPAVVMVCETVDAVEIAPGEEADEVTSWSGRLHVTLPERAVVYPSGGVGRLPIQENRSFDYTAPEYDDSGWIGAGVLSNVELAREIIWLYNAFIRLFNATPNDLAKNYPDPFAYLLWAPGGTVFRGNPLPLDSGGDCYFRQLVTIPNTGTYRLFGVCDDTADYFVDGVPAFSIGQGGFMQTGQADVALTAGTHLVAMHVNNRKDSQVAWSLNPGGIFNPGFGAWSLFRSDNVTIQGFVAHSDHTAKMAAYATAVPGMTPGRALRLLWEEATARGVLMPALGFTDLVDSDGNPWQVVDISTRVGTDYFTVLREMSATYIDFAMRVGTFTLDAWARGGRGTTRAVALHGPTSPTDPATSTVGRIERKGEQ